MEIDLELDAAEKVLNNDYLMMKIGKMLSFKDQFSCQATCSHLQSIMVSMWKRDCEDAIQMNRDKFGILQPDEFIHFLRINKEHLKRLTINQNDSIPLPGYFSHIYSNLLELHLNWNANNGDLAGIVEKCPQLQLLEIDGGRSESLLPSTEVENILEPLYKLKYLRTLLLKRLHRALRYEYFWSLVAHVPLEHLELYNVRIMEDRLETEWKSRANLESIRIFRHSSNKKCTEYMIQSEFIHKLSNIEELETLCCRGFANNRHLEKLQLLSCTTCSLWDILQHTHVKELEIYCVSTPNDENYNVARNVREIVINIQILKIHYQYIEAMGFWSHLFCEPHISFENLQELKVHSRLIGDEEIQKIALKCPRLISLHVVDGMISGRYISGLQNLQSLTLDKSVYVISWYWLYAIISSLPDLQHLELSRLLLIPEGFTMPENLPHELAKSLKVLKLDRLKGNPTFFVSLLRKCPTSFQNLHTLHIQGPGKYKDLSYFISNLKGLSTLHFEDCLQLHIEVNPRCSIKHLTFINCTLVGSSILRLLNNARTETLTVLLTTLVDDTRKDRYRLDKSFPNIRFVKLEYPNFIKTLSIWNRFLENSSRFEICCLDHEDHNVVLEKLFKYSRKAKQRHVVIHVNSYASKYFTWKNRILVIYTQKYQTYLCMPPLGVVHPRI